MVAKGIFILKKQVLHLLYFLSLALFLGQLSCSSCFDSTTVAAEEDVGFLPPCKYDHCDPREPMYLIPPAVDFDIDPNGGKYPIDISINLTAGLGYGEFTCKNPDDTIDYGYISKIEWRILPDPWSDENSVTFAPSILDDNSAKTNYSIDRHFDEPGDYTVEVRVTDDCNNITTEQEIINIDDNRCPQFRVECNNCYGIAPLEPDIRVFTKYNTTEFDPDDTVIYWEMDFDGDGNPEIGPIEKEDDGSYFYNIDSISLLRYNCVGAHAISVTVEDPYHCRVTETVDSLASVYAEPYGLNYNPDDTPTAIKTFRDDDNNGYLYMAEGSSGIRVFDITEDSVVPQYIGKTPFYYITDSKLVYYAGSHFNDMQIAEFNGTQYLYAAGNPFFAVYKLSNFDKPVLANRFHYYSCGSSAIDERFGEKICMPPVGDSNYGYAYVTDKERNNIYGIFVDGSDIESHFIVNLNWWGWNGKTDGSTCMGTEVTGFGYYNRLAAGDNCPFTWPPSGGCCRECGLVTLGACGMSIIDLSRPEKLGHTEGNGGGYTPNFYACDDGDLRRFSIWPNTRNAVYYKPDGVRQTYFTDVKVIDDYAFVLNSYGQTNALLVYALEDLWDYGLDYDHAATAPVAIVTLANYGDADKIVVKDNRAEGGSVTLLVQSQIGTDGFQEVDVTDFLSSGGVTTPVITRGYLAGDYVSDVDSLDNYVYMADQYGLRTYNETQSPALNYFRTSGELDRVNYFDNKIFIHKQKAGIEVFTAQLGVTHVPMSYIDTFGEAFDSQELIFPAPTTTEPIKLLAVWNKENDEDGEQANVQVFDVGNIYAPYEIEYFAGDATCLAGWRNYLAAYIGGKLTVYRFSQTENPVLEDVWQTGTISGASITDLEMSEGLLVAMTPGRQIDTYTFDPDAATLELELAGSQNSVIPYQIALDGHQLYYMTIAGVTSVDLSDPSVILPGPSVNVFDDIGDSPVNLYASNGVVMVACGNSGLAIYQNCDAANFNLVGHYIDPLIYVTQLDGNYYESGSKTYFNLYYINSLMNVLDYIRVDGSVICGFCSE